MIRPICKDPMFLSIKSSDATLMDFNVANDLLETFMAHRHECVGMAANMIGISKRIIVFYDEKKKICRMMFNPVILKKTGEYETEEGCLSLSGVRKTKRYKKITVQYQDASMKIQNETFTDYTAQIIQHEIDMTNGILI